MTVFENLKPLKAAQLIAQQVRDAMISGRLSVGDRLPRERDLIKQFGYSRAVVREGLRLLEADGLIAMQAGRNGGAVICRPESHRLASTLDLILRLQRTSIHDVHEAQRLIEPLIINLAIERGTAQDLARIRRTIDLIERDPDDPEIVRQQSNLFHSLLGEAAHNKVIALVSGLIRQIVIQMGYTGDKAEALTIARIHRKILDAIENGDSAAATRRALRHLDASEGALKAGARKAVRGVMSMTGGTPRWSTSKLRAKAPSRQR